MTLLLMIICHKLPPAPTQHHMELTPPCWLHEAGSPLSCPVLFKPTPLYTTSFISFSLPHQTQLVSRLQTEAILAICRGWVDTNNAGWPWLPWPGVAVSRQIILLRHNNWIHSAVNRVCDSRKLGFLNSGISIVMNIQFTVPSNSTSSLKQVVLHWD